MAMFTKKPDWEQKLSGEVGGTATRGYGIAEAIQLMRTLPVDQNADLVVRVVRATLGSLNVRLPDIIDDATKKEKTTRDKIAAEHVHIGGLEKQLEAHRGEIAALEADLKETSAVKERLQQAEALAGPGDAPPSTTIAEASVMAASAP